MAPPVLTPDLNELRGFCMAADLGSLGRAAVRLHVSQPSLSKRLASLESKVGARLLERSPRGVALTPAGRRLYGQARALLEEADEVAEVMLGIRHTGAVVRLAASHSATEAFVAVLLTHLDDGHPLAVELVTANSQVVRSLVADGRADVGVAASRPGSHPESGHPRDRADRRRDRLRGAARAQVGAEAHRWRRSSSSRRGMVVRDPSSNARWTVDAVLGASDLRLADPLVEAATPEAALAEARRRTRPGAARAGT